MVSFSKENYSMLHFLLSGGVFGVLHWLVIYVFNIDFNTMYLGLIYVVMLSINMITFSGTLFLSKLLEEQQPMLLLLAKVGNLILSLTFLIVAKYTLTAFDKSFAIHFSIAYLLLLVVSTKQHISELK